MQKSWNSEIIGEGTYGTIKRREMSPTVIKEAFLYSKQNCLITSNVQEICFLSSVYHKLVLPALKVEKDGNYVTTKMDYGGTCLTAWVETNRYKDRVLLLQTMLFDIIEFMSILEREKLHHGDLSPNNVLINQENQIFLIDWGNASHYPESNESVV